MGHRAGPPPLPEAAMSINQWREYRKYELVEKCKALGLAVTGSKDDISLRLYIFLGFVLGGVSPLAQPVCHLHVNGPGRNLWRMLTWT